MPSEVIASVIGAVSGGYERYLEQMRDRSRLSLGGGRFAEDHFAQVAVARAASQLDAAILQTDRNVTDIWARVVAHEPIPMRLRLRARRDQVMGVERAVEAIDLLFKTAGGNSLRMWKDYFPNSTIHGLDLYDKSALAEARITIHQGDQRDPACLRQIHAEMGGIDIVIDKLSTVLNANRRSNFKFVARNIPSGSASKCRARLTTANSRSPTSVAACASSC